MPVNYKRFLLLFVLLLPFQLLPLASRAGQDNEAFSEGVALLSKFVQIPSVTGNERDAGIFLANLCRDKGLYVRVFTDDPDSYNFAASVYPLSLGKPNIIFLNHFDVVPAGHDSLWKYPAYSGKVAEGFVWGRGSVDNKVMGIQQLMALSSLVEKATEENLNFNFTMLSVSNEEEGGKKGAALVVDNFLAELNPVAVYGEGGAGLRNVSLAKPDMAFFGIEVAQKIGVWFVIRAKDPLSGHGSIPMQEYPARQIVHASASLLNRKQPLILTPASKNMLREIGRHERGMRGLALRNIGFFRHFIGKTLRNDPFTNAVLTNTITLTMLQNSGGAINQVAYSSMAAFDCRILPGTDIDAFLNKIKQHMHYDFDEFQIIGRSPDSGASETGHFYEALETAIHKVFENVAVAPMLFPAHNDNTFFRNKGVPSYGLLPMILSHEEVQSIHNVNERVAIDSVNDGIAVYKALLDILSEKN